MYQEEKRLRHELNEIVGGVLGQRTLISSTPICAMLVYLLTPLPKLEWPGGMMQCPVLATRGAAFGVLFKFSQSSYSQSVLQIIIIILYVRILTQTIRISSCRLPLASLCQRCCVSFPGAFRLLLINGIDSYHGHLVLAFYCLPLSAQQ